MSGSKARQRILCPIGIFLLILFPAIAFFPRSALLETADTSPPEAYTQQASVVSAGDDSGVTLSTTEWEPVEPVAGGTVEGSPGWMDLTPVWYGWFSGGGSSEGSGGSSLETRTVVINAPGTPARPVSDQSPITGSPSTTIRVPADYPTIQAAIDAATDGDTVLVSPGTYTENLSFNGKNITVTSSDGPDVTILTGNSSNPILYFRSGGGQLSGFTIRNVLSVTVVSLYGASPTIAGNIFESSYRFGRILIGNGSSSRIEGNIFRNSACYRGLLYFYNNSSPNVLNNIFIDNECEVIWMSSSFVNSPKFYNNTIIGNQGGIHLDCHNLALNEIKNNIIMGNDEGINISYTNSCIMPSIANNLVYNNTVNYTGIADQTGINGNISTDPLFLAPAENDFHLIWGSPAIDSGDPGMPAFSSQDFEGSPRVVDGTGSGTPRIDIGAYESNPQAAPEVHFTVDKTGDIPPFTVAFTSSVTGPVTDYVWDFGDGSMSSDRNPTHAYGEGAYTVSLAVSGPSGSATLVKEKLIKSLVTVHASAGSGGTISPSGNVNVPYGDSKSFTITPSSGFLLYRVLVDGAFAGNQQSFTLNNVTGSRTITTAFQQADYFGMELGNYLTYITNGNGQRSEQEGSRIQSLDPTSFPSPHNTPAYVEQETRGGAVQGWTWCQQDSQALYLVQEQAGAQKITFPATLMIVPPNLLSRRWVTWSTVTSQDLSLQTFAQLVLNVHPKAMITVPAGTFLSYPISYQLTLTQIGWSATTRWTDWFVPYIGVVRMRSSSPSSESVLTDFGVFQGTATTPPPIVAAVSRSEGNKVAIQGFNFGRTRGTCLVAVGGKEVTEFSSWRDRRIVCTLPDGVASGQVSVSNDNWTSNTFNFR